MGHSTFLSSVERKIFKRSVNNTVKTMAYVLADNIISPLGETSEENYLAVKTGKSGIHVYTPGSHGIPDGFTASLLFSDFEDLILRSARKAIANSQINVAKDKIIFILSSTKGPIENLGREDDKNVYLGEVAQRISVRLGIAAKPFVVCNACISGLSALILANRLLAQGKYDYAVVCGCDTPDRFIISGFQSLKALSFEPCRPFDIERFGLNLGEAAATMVLAKDMPCKELNKAIWQIGCGFVKNDAFHISAPSKTGEGLYQALLETLQGVNIDDLAFINAHGTATLFNDQMESISIERAGLSEIQTNALKGYFGHTLGAAGILETILSMKAIDDHLIIGTLGYGELGVSGKMRITAENIPTNKHSFIKMMSGFGGCNAAIFAEKKDLVNIVETCDKTTFVKRHEVCVSPKSVSIDGCIISITSENESENLLTSIYKQKIGGYPKYYKMDGLCRLGFVASELLLQAEGEERFVECDDRAIVLFNRSSSISSDKKYLESIQDKDNYFPSPSVFVYTLPNIVTGEIAIRNHYHGETSFYILPQEDVVQMREILETTFMDRNTKSVLTGWIDYVDDSHFEANLFIMELEQHCRIIDKRNKTMKELIKELKEEIIEALNLEEMTADDIDENEALFGEGLGLDSIDALELIVLLEKKYGIKLANPATGKEIFKSVATIADYVSKNRKK